MGRVPRIVALRIMKTFPILVPLLVSLAPLRAGAQEKETAPEVGADTVQMHFSESSDVRDVLALYAAITGRKVWLALNIYGPVPLVSETRLTKEKALELIRTTLLEKHGIALRETEGKETFVSWSEEPKYVAVRKKMEAEAEARFQKAHPEQPGAVTGERRRIRIISPKPAPSQPAEVPK